MNHVNVAAEANKFALDKILPDDAACFAELGLVIIAGGERGYGRDNVTFGRTKRGSAFGCDFVIQCSGPCLGTDHMDQVERMSQ